MHIGKLEFAVLKYPCVLKVEKQLENANGNVDAYLLILHLKEILFIRYYKYASLYL